MRQKRVPQRTCVACRKKGPKPEFVRIVLTAEGEYLVDPPRRTPGRGAYLCRVHNCWTRGIKRGALDRALKGSGKQEARAALLEWARREFTQENNNEQAVSASGDGE